jgi:hypothetical protein
MTAMAAAAVLTACASGPGTLSSGVSIVTLSDAQIAEIRG